MLREDGGGLIHGLTTVRRLPVRPWLVLHGTADVDVPDLHSVRLPAALLKQGSGTSSVTRGRGWTGAAPGGSRPGDPRVPAAETRNACSLGTFLPSFDKNACPR